MVTMPTLTRVRETKICDLMASGQSTTRYEASGVLVRDGHYFVVFDDRTEIGRFSDDLRTWRDAGQLYQFPRSESGKIRYGNIEGVAWISPTRIVTVSDRRKKKNQPDKALSEKDQSVHIFDIPS
jgi:hypothetical protein